jgi:hypothetical protein
VPGQPTSSIRDVAAFAAHAEPARERASRGGGGSPPRPPRPPAPPSSGDDPDRRIDERAQPLDEQERAVARVFAAEGAHVRSVARGTDPSPDIEVDGVRWEIKTLRPGATSARVVNRLSKAKKQARNAVVDARGAGLSEAEARRAIRRTLGAYPGKFNHIRILGDGYDVRWPPEES